MDESRQEAPMERPGSPPGRAFFLLVLFCALLLRLLPVFQHVMVDEPVILGNITTFFERRTIVPTHFDYPTFFSYLAALPTIATALLAPAFGSVRSAHEFLAYQVFESPIPYAPIRLTSVALGWLSVYILYRLGRRHWDELTGLLAASFLTISISHIQRSALGLPDAATAFFSCLTLYAALSAMRAEGLRPWALAGVCAGLLTAAKYNGALLLVCIPAAYGVALQRRGILLRPAQWRLLPMTLAAGACVAAFFVASPGWLIAPGAFWKAFVYDCRHMQEGHIGFYGATYGRWLKQFWDVEKGLSVLFAAGWLFALLRPTGERIVLALCALAGFAVIGGWRYGDAHYFLFLYPVFCLLAAVFCRSAVKRLPSGWRKWAAAGVLGACVVPSLAVAARNAVLSVAVEDNRDAALKWIYHSIPPEAVIAKDPWYSPRLISHAEAAAWLNSPLKGFFAKELQKRATYYVIDIAQQSPRTQMRFVFPESLSAVPADFMVVSSWWHERFENPLPPPDNPSYEEDVAGRRFYRELFGAGKDSGWTRIGSFDSPVGPRVEIYGRSLNPRPGP